VRKKQVLWGREGERKVRPVGRGEVKKTRFDHCNGVPTGKGGRSSCCEQESNPVAYDQKTKGEAGQSSTDVIPDLTIGRDRKDARGVAQEIKDMKSRKTSSRLDPCRRRKRKRNEASLEQMYLQKQCESTAGQGRKSRTGKK